MLGLAWALWGPLVAAAPDQGTRPPATAFFGPEETEEALLSPSGRYLAVVRSMPSGASALYILDAPTLKRTREIVSHSYAELSERAREALRQGSPLTDRLYGISHLRWAGEDHVVYLMTRREREGGGESYLVAVGRTAGKPEVLIGRGDGFERGIGPVLPYGYDLLSVPSDGSPDVIVGLKDETRGDLRTYQPMRLHLPTGKLRPLDTGELKDVTDWMFDVKGEPRVAQTMAAGRVRVYWRAPGRKEWQLVQDAARSERPWTPYDLDAAGNLFVLHAKGPEATQVLSRLDPATLQPASRATVEVTGFDFRGSLVNDADSGRLLGIRVLTDSEGTHWMQPGMKALQEKIDGLLPHATNRLDCRRCDSDQPVVLVRSWADDDPGSYYLWRSDTQKLGLLGRARSAFKPEQAARLAFQRIQARDGRPLPLWLTLPPSAPGAQPPPVVVMVHGGPNVRGVYWGWSAMAQFLASRGYAVLQPEFRGSDGYGQAHKAAGYRQWGQGMQDDVADALQWAAAKGHVDGKRACIMGESYGGYSALMGLARHADLYRCGVAAMAITDLTRVLDSSWWWTDDVASESREHEMRQRIGDPKTDADMLRANSPVFLADRMRAPVLLVHGNRDQRVPLVHAEDIRRALRTAGNEPEWLLMDLEGHSWSTTANRVLYAERVEQFLAKHLPAGPRP